jgi:hypothetical protein
MLWLVELPSKEHPDVRVVEVVEAPTHWRAIDQAFFTRNIGSSWIITHIENEFGAVFTALS